MAILHIATRENADAMGLWKKGTSLRPPNIGADMILSVTREVLEKGGRVELVSQASIFATKDQIIVQSVGEEDPTPKTDWEPGLVYLIEVP